MAWRFTLDHATKKASSQMLSGVAGEFPKINDAWLGRELRYGYFATTRGLSPLTMTDGMARHDFTTGQTLVIEGVDGLTSPSEPVFVQRRGATDENDGYLLSLWWNPATALSSCWSTTPSSSARDHWPGSSCPFGFRSPSTAPGPRPSSSTPLSQPRTSRPRPASDAGRLS